MNNQIIFSGVSHVEIQGPRVLRFVELTSTVAVYELIGFEEIGVIIHDYRQQGLWAISNLLETQDVRSFAQQFNFPSTITISENPSGNILVQLKDTSVKAPLFCLWISIGNESMVPNYNYYYYRFSYLPEDKIAFLAIYKSAFSYQRPDLFLPSLVNTY